MSLLSICQDAARELGIAIPGSVVSNIGDPDAQLLLRIARKEGYLLAQRAFWTRLRHEHVFVTVAADSQGLASLPSDFDCLVPETVYNRTRRRPVYGPITPQEWQEYKAGLIAAINPSFLIRGDEILMTPQPAPFEDVTFEYISSHWARDADGNRQETFLADSDSTVFRDAILTQGVIWRYQAHKSWESDTARLEYERMVVDRMMRDGAKPRIDTSERTSGAARRGRAGMTDYDTIKP